MQTTKTPGLTKRRHGETTKRIRPTGNVAYALFCMVSSERQMSCPASRRHWTEGVDWFSTPPMAESRRATSPPVSGWLASVKRPPALPLDQSGFRRERIGSPGTAT
jgi:hypothetical protein